ncbi:MAG: aminoacyl-tRNA hydrolase [Candidatus Zixiibacteriota bacterium]|nr:MAG: aminoacyl-tRNA hydrolase [candidate division Zixibacteria bacterium]
MANASGIELVVGLGNPGSRYRATWHNLGFMVLDHWAASRNLGFKPGRGDYYHLAWQGYGRSLTFLKPTSYMNLSGVPVAQVARYRKLTPENILVVCDDVALPLGTLRLRRSGSGGGHKGLSSIIAQVGSDQIPRLRLGAWTGQWKGELADYVLSTIPPSLRDDLAEVIAVSAQALDCILQEGLEAAMNRFNRNVLTPPPAAKAPGNPDEGPDG